MNELIQHIIILALVLAAIAWLARQAHLTLRCKKTTGCHGASTACGSCALANLKKTPIRNQRTTS